MRLQGGQRDSRYTQEKQRKAQAHPLKIKTGAKRHRGLNLGDIRYALKSLMWRDVGVERDAKHLRDAAEEIGHWSEYVMDKEFHSPHGWELQNMLLLSGLITDSAQERKETRGVHYRRDFPSRDDENWKRHIALKQGAG
ncbi:MAG: hypothetical protein ACE5KK_07010 [Candidatus Brocadiales bacterium]